MTSNLHDCAPPDLSTWDDDEWGWTCPECGQEWVVEQKNYCHSCYRGDGPAWERYTRYTGPVTDGGFPLMSVRRGGITYPGRNSV